MESHKPTRTVYAHYHTSKQGVLKGERSGTMFPCKFGGTWAFNCGLGLAVRKKCWGKSEATSDSFLYLIVLKAFGQQYVLLKHSISAMLREFLLTKENRKMVTVFAFNIRTFSTILIRNH